LDGDDVMLLDALNTIYIWVGNGANNTERDAAKDTANVCITKPPMFVLHMIFLQFFIL
jgi:hypothetical protein